MNKDQEQPSLSKWFSTYGLITAERILEKYNIKLTHTDLIAVLKNEHSIFYSILKIPIKNVLNGIIFNQAKDYQVYAQKLFIDYLLSGPSSKGEQASGGETREEIEEKRKELMATGERFQEKEQEHRNLIAESQKYLISYTSQLTKSMDKAINSCHTFFQEKGIDISKAKLKQAVYSALVNSDKNNPSSFENALLNSIDTVSTQLNSEEINNQFQKLFNDFAAIDERLAEYENKTKLMSEDIKAFRNEFYNEILRVNELLYQLSDYKINDEQMKVNKEALNFDRDVI